MSSLSRLLLIAASLAVPLATQSAAAGEPGPAQAVNLSLMANGPTWLGSMAGEKLVAVDGSALTLAPTEGGLSLARLSQTGVMQKSTLAYLSDKLGTVTDDSDPAHVTGLFRETDNGLEVEFADGRTESLVANTAGGISQTSRASTGESICTSWYPPDHFFSAAERKSALDAYAARLGLAKRSKVAAHAAPACVPSIKVVKNKIDPNAERSIIMTTRPDTARISATAVPAKGANTPALIPVAVRASEVHLIDTPEQALVAAKSVASVTAAPVGPQTQTPTTPAQETAANSAVSAGAQMSTPQFATATAAPSGGGASDCLTVESDGANLGFRNHCAFGVQFAYCLQRTNDTASACDTGARTGAVAANGFVAVVLDANIKTADAEHDFRWVACNGSAGAVVAHLDRSEPPAGRCVRTGT
jgi:hypothetical protein